MFATGVFGLGRSVVCGLWIETATGVFGLGRSVVRQPQVCLD